MNGMGRRVLAMGVFLAASVGLVRGAAAAVPMQISHQGRLFTANGEPVNDVLSVTFAIYAAEDDDEPLWSEVIALSFDEGYFSTVLDFTEEQAAKVFDGSVRYIGITVGDDQEMKPRASIGSVPYAMVANNTIGEITPKLVKIGGRVVIDESGNWVGDSSGIAGPAGVRRAGGTDRPQGPSGAAAERGPVGPAGPAGPAGRRDRWAPRGRWAPWADGPVGDRARGADGAGGPVGPGPGPTGRRDPRARGPEGLRGRRVWSRQSRLRATWLPFLMVAARVYLRRPPGVGDITGSQRVTGSVSAPLGLRSSSAAFVARSASATSGAAPRRARQLLRRHLYEPLFHADRTTYSVSATTRADRGRMECRHVPPQ